MEHESRNSWLEMRSLSSCLLWQHGDIKSQSLSSDPERISSGVGRIQLNKHQNSYLSFTTSLMEIKNMPALVDVSMRPWATIRKQYSNTSRPQQEVSDKGPAEKIKI
jgi:hypothetical protein